jgi:F0F1-type ATP synthase membrane subunit b/b'
MVKKKMLNAFNLDYTVLIVFLIVWILYLILNKIYFYPIGKKIEERDELKKQHVTEIESIKKLIDEKTAGIEKSINTAKMNSRKMNAKLIKEARAAADKFIVLTREENKDRSDKSMKELKKEIEEAEVRIMQQIDEFASGLQKKIK